MERDRADKSSACWLKWSILELLASLQSTGRLWGALLWGGPCELLAGLTWEALP